MFTTNKKNLHSLCPNSYSSAHFTLRGTEDFPIVFVGHFVDLQSLAPCLPINLDLPRGRFFFVSPVAYPIRSPGLLVLFFRFVVEKAKPEATKNGGRSFCLKQTLLFFQHLTKIMQRRPEYPGIFVSKNFEDNDQSDSMTQRCSKPCIT